VQVEDDEPLIAAQRAAQALQARLDAVDRMPLEHQDEAERVEVGGLVVDEEDARRGAAGPRRASCAPAPISIRRSPSWTVPSAGRSSGTASR
jgi:hypothetical protein